MKFLTTFLLMVAFLEFHLKPVEAQVGVIDTPAIVAPASGGGGTPLSPSPDIAFWKMNEGGGPSFADSVSSNNGSWTGSPAWGGGYITLNGSTQYGSVADATALNPTAITVVARIRLISLPPIVAAVVSKNNSTVYYQLQVRSDGKLAVYVHNGNNQDYDDTGSHTLSIGQWYVLAFTYNTSSGLVGYVNGAQDASVSTSGNLFAPTGAPLTIGTDTANAGRELNADIDYVAIWSTALTSTQIANIYAAGAQ